MSSVSLAINILLLFGILVLVLIEEVRHHRLKERVVKQQQKIRSIAHTLLSAIMTMRKFHGAIKSKEMGKLSLAQLSAFNQIEIASDNIIEIYEEFLQNTHVPIVAVHAGMEKFRISSSVQSAMDAVSHCIVEKNQKIFVEKPILEPCVYADPSLIHGTLDELITNATNYTPQNGSIFIKITSDEKVVQVHVKDTGIGVKPEDRDAIFQKYFRGQEARNMAQGNGLGLFFCSQMLSHCRGAIHLNNVYKNGAEFIVTIPREGMSSE